jgi:hypothetical protein
VSNAAAGPRVGQFYKLAGERVEVVAVGEKFATVRTPRRRWYVALTEWPRLRPKTIPALET